MEQMQEFETEARNDLIEGRNAVIEALRAGRTIDKIFIAKGDVDKTLGHIASKALQRPASSSRRPTAASSTP